MMFVEAPVSMITWTLCSIVREFFSTKVFLQITDIFFLELGSKKAFWGVMPLRWRADNGWCNLHNAGCIMQVAGHVLWPRAAWLYHVATILMTQSFLVSGGLVSKLNN